MWGLLPSKFTDHLLCDSCMSANKTGTAAASRNTFSGGRDCRVIDTTIVCLTAGMANTWCGARSSRGSCFPKSWAGRAQSCREVGPGWGGGVEQAQGLLGASLAVLGTQVSQAKCVLGRTQGLDIGWSEGEQGGLLRGGDPCTLLQASSSPWAWC